AHDRRRARRAFRHARGAGHPRRIPARPARADGHRDGDEARLRAHRAAAGSVFDRGGAVRRTARACLALAALLLAAPAALAPAALAQQVIADLSRHLVAITTGFAGAEVLLFGAG